MEVCPYSYFWWCGYFRALWVSLVTIDEFSVCVTKIYFKDRCLKLSFTNIRGLLSNFIGCKSFLELNSPDTLALCDTYLDDSIDSSNYSVRGYLILIRKDSLTHMHGFITGLISIKFCGFLLCFQLALLQCLTSFSFIDHLLYLCA